MASGINSIVETDDADIPDKLGVFAEISARYKLLAPGCGVLGATLDFAHA